MNKIKQAFSVLQGSGNFEPSQLHEGKDRLWITPYAGIIDFKQLQLAMAAAELFDLLPILDDSEEHESCRFFLINHDC